MLDFVAPYADSMIAACQFVLSLAVVPTTWAGRRIQGVPLTTSALMIGGMAVMFVALTSRGMTLSALSCTLAIVIWGVVAIERIRGSV